MNALAEAAVTKDDYVRTRALLCTILTKAIERQKDRSGLFAKMRAILDEQSSRVATQNDRVDGLNRSQFEISTAGMQASELDRAQLQSGGHSDLRLAPEPSQEQDKRPKDIIVEATLVLQLTDLYMPICQNDLADVISSIAQLAPEQPSDSQRKITLKYTVLVSSPQGSLSQSAVLELPSSSSEAVSVLVESFSSTIIAAQAEAVKVFSVSDWQLELSKKLVERATQLGRERSAKTSLLNRDIALIPVYAVIAKSGSKIAKAGAVYQEAFVQAYPTSVVVAVGNASRLMRDV